MCVFLSFLFFFSKGDPKDSQSMGHTCLERVEILGFLSICCKYSKELSFLDDIEASLLQCNMT